MKSIENTVKEGSPAVDRCTKTVLEPVNTSVEEVSEPQPFLYNQHTLPLQRRNLFEKVMHSRKLIKKAFKLSEQMGIDHGLYVGFSGGKDSQVLLDLVRGCNVRFLAVHNLTTIDPPENIRFIRKYYPTVLIRHPKETFLQLVRRKGLPTVNRRYCCAILKEGDGAGEVVLTGVRADESKKRSEYAETQIRSRRVEHALHKGKKSLDEILESQHRCVKGKDSVMVYPMLDWTELDVWNYIEFYGLPVNPCYDVSHRVGCMFCPFTSKKELNYYEYTYPVWVDHILNAVQDYLDRNQNVECANFRDAREYYDWWKSKVDVKTWRAKQAQSKLEFEGSTGDFPRFD